VDAERSTDDSRVGEPKKPRSLRFSCGLMAGDNVYRAAALLRKIARQFMIAEERLTDHLLRLRNAECSRNGMEHEQDFLPAERQRNVIANRGCPRALGERAP